MRGGVENHVELFFFFFFLSFTPTPPPLRTPPPFTSTEEPEVPLLAAVGSLEISLVGEASGEEVHCHWCKNLPILITHHQYAAKVNMSINGPQGRDYRRPAAYEMQIPPFRMLHTPLSCVISAMSAHSNYLGKCTN